MKQITLCTSLFLICVTATASEWKFVTTTNKEVFSIDISSIVSRGPVLQAWSRTILLGPEPSDNSGLDSYFKQDSQPKVASKILYHFGCESRILGRVQSITYNTAGEVTDIRTLPASQVVFEDVAPDTVGEKLLEFVCSHRLPKQERKSTIKPNT